MAEVKFGPDSGSKPVAPVTEKVVTPVTTEAVPVQVPATSGALIPQSYVPKRRDLILPRLNISQNIGKLKDFFSPGTLVYNQQTPLFTPPVLNKDTGAVIKPGTPAVELFVLDFYPERFVEKVDGGGQGLIVDTEDAVRQNGGTLDWNEHSVKKKDGMKLFEVLLDGLVLIKRPAHCNNDGTVFVYKVDGAEYALGLWGFRGMAYTAIRSSILTPRLNGCLREGGFPSYRFSVTTRWKDGKKPGSGAWIPIAVPTEKTSPDMLKFINTVLQG